MLLPLFSFSNSSCVCEGMIKVTCQKYHTIFINVDRKFFDLLVISLELRLPLISQTGSRQSFLGINVFFFPLWFAVFKWLHFSLLHKLRLTKKIIFPSQSPSICTCAVTLCTVLSTKVFTLLDPAYQSPKPRVIVQAGHEHTPTCSSATCLPDSSSIWPFPRGSQSRGRWHAARAICPLLGEWTCVCVHVHLLVPPTWLTAYNRTRQITFHCLGDGKIVQCTFADLRWIYSNVCYIKVHQCYRLTQPWQ